MLKHKKKVKNYDFKYKGYYYEMEDLIFHYITRSNKKFFNKWKKVVIVPVRDFKIWPYLDMLHDYQKLCIKNKVKIKKLGNEIRIIDFKEKYLNK